MRRLTNGIVIDVTQGWRKPKTRTMLPPAMSTKIATPKQTPPKTLSVAPIEGLTPSAIEPLPSTSVSVSVSPPPPPAPNSVSATQSPPCDREATSPTQNVSSPQKTPAKNSPSPPHSLKETTGKVKKVLPFVQTRSPFSFISFSFFLFFQFFFFFCLFQTFTLTFSSSSTFCKYYKNY